MSEFQFQISMSNYSERVEFKIPIEILSACGITQTIKRDADGKLVSREWDNVWCNANAETGELTIYQSIPKTEATHAQ